MRSARIIFRRFARTLAAFLLLFSTVAGFIPFSPKAGAATSPYVKTQNGELDFSTGDSSLTQSITAVDNQANAFILVWGTGGDQDIERVKFAASFNSDSEIQIDRGESGSSAKAAWQVVEADTAAATNAFSTQTGTILVGSGATSGNNTISSVTTGQSTVVVQPSCGSSDNTTQVQFRGSLSSSTQIDVNRTTSGSACTVRYWVVEWSGDVNVYNGSTANTTGSTTASVGGTVNLSRSVLFMSWDNDTNGLAQHATRGYLSSTSQLTFSRATSTGTNNVEWSVVEFPAGASVQADNGTSSPTFSSGTTTDETISAVTGANTLYTHSVEVTGTGTAIVRGQTIAYLTSTTNLRFEKQYTTQTATFSYYVADLSAWTFNSGPDAPTLYNDDGGSNQIAFNNARQNDTTPIFRASATHTASFDTFELELNTQADFGGTSYTEQFSGTYSSGTQYNLQTTGSLSLPTTDGVTYYARARASADSGSSWGAWSSGTWTYTYKSSGDADWFQTTDEQFDTGTLSDTQTSGSDSVELGAVASSVSRTGSGGSIASAANSSSSSVTVPSDAEIMVVGVIGYSAGNGNYYTNGTSVTIGGDAMTQGAVTTTDTTAMGGVWYRVNPTSGSQTFAWDWEGSSAPDNGTIFVYAFYKGIDTASPIGGSDVDETGGTSATVTLSPTSGDAIVAVGGGGLVSSGSWTNATEIVTDTINNGGQTTVGSLGEAFTSGSTNVTYSTADSITMTAGVVLNQGSGTASSGTILSPAIAYDSLDGATSWDEFTWSEDETNGSISAQLYYTSSTTCDTVIPNAALTGNESGFTSGPIDISGLNTTTYDEICVRGTLTDSGGTPFLQDWSVSWLASSNTPPNSPASLAQVKTDDTSLATGDWTNETSVKFTAQASDTDNPENLQLCIEIDELGTSFSNTEDSCGSAVAYSGSAVSVTHTISSLSDGTEYHWQARIKDDENAYSSWVSYGGNAESARDVGVDTSAPTGGTVYDGTNTGVDASFNDNSLSSLSANWGSFNFSASGIASYDYSIGTSQGGTDVLTWTDNGTSTSVTANSLTLQTSQIYYVNVRANDSAGNSSVVSSDGQSVLPSLSFGISTTNLQFQNLNPGNSYTDTEDTTLTTSTNAYGGYVVRAYATGMLSTDSLQIGWFDGGSYASPATWGSSTGYGYTSSDSDIQGGGDKFGSGSLYAPFTTSSPGDIIADHVANVTGTAISNQQFTITHRVTVDEQEAGSYNTGVIYAATAEY